LAFGPELTAESVANDPNCESFEDNGGFRLGDTVTFDRVARTREPSRSGCVELYLR